MRFKTASQGAPCAGYFHNARCLQAQASCLSSRLQHMEALRSTLHLQQAPGAPVLVRSQRKHVGFCDVSCQLRIIRLTLQSGEEGVGGAGWGWGWGGARQAWTTSKAMSDRTCSLRAHKQG